MENKNSSSGEKPKKRVVKKPAIPKVVKEETYIGKTLTSTAEIVSLYKQGRDLSFKIDNRPQWWVTLWGMDAKLESLRVEVTKLGEKVHPELKGWKWTVLPMAQGYIIKVTGKE